MREKNFNLLNQLALEPPKSLDANSFGATFWVRFSRVWCWGCGQTRQSWSCRRVWSRSMGCAPASVKINCGHRLGLALNTVLAARPHSSPLSSSSTLRWRGRFQRWRYRHRLPYRHGDPPTHAAARTRDDRDLSVEFYGDPPSCFECVSNQSGTAHPALEHGPKVLAHHVES